MSTEMLQARENLMEAIQAFLKKYDQIPPKEKSMALLLAEERFLKIKQAVNEASKVSSQYWKPPIFYDDDDEENSIPLRDIISELPLSVAITPDLPITDSLIMEDEHLSTIPEKESDEFIKSSLRPFQSQVSSEEHRESDNAVNPLFDEVLENIKSKDSYVSNLDEPNSKLSALIWKRIVVAVLLPVLIILFRIMKPSMTIILPNVLPTHPILNLDFILLSEPLFAYIVWIFLPFLTYPVALPYLLSCGSEDTIFDPGISTFHFSSLKPVAYENPIVIFLFFCFCPKDKGIRGEIPQDHEDPCLFSILQSSGLRSFAYFGILNPDHVVSFGSLRIHPRGRGFETHEGIIPSTLRQQPRGSGGHHLTRPLTGGPTVVDRWSSGGQRWSTDVDRRWPLLTAVIDRWLDNGAETVDRTRGTNHKVTRVHLIIRYEVLFIVCRSEVHRSRVLEADVARCD
ncbi:hypothetical protein Tco_0256301 [Tanacetum coccineum]